MNYSFAVISDTHYFSSSLTDSGRAYELRSGSDQKCILESAAIVDAAFKKLADDNSIDAVLISGDLTNDGEIVCHEEFSKKLYELSLKKKIFVTTATHDFCCDKNARTYFGNKEEQLLETADILYLRKTYSPFGCNEAIAVFEIFNGLCSYVVQLCDGVRLFALNDDQNGVDGSGYSEKHLRWIISQMKAAKDSDNRIIVMQHHVLLSHFTELLTKGGVCCKNREAIAECFAENGTELLFVGHSHWQNITEYTSENGNKMIQVNVASLSGHPAPVFKVNLTDDGCQMHTEYITEFEFNGKKLTGEYITQHTKELIYNVLYPAVNGDKSEFTDRLAALGIHNKKFEKYFSAIKRLCAYLTEADVGSLSKTVNCLTFGKGINKKSAFAVKDMKVLDIAVNVFLNLFDGGIDKYEKGSDAYKVVSDFISLPSRILRFIPLVPDKIKVLLSEIHETICLIMDDGNDNNYKKYTIKKELKQ